jgi:hypothetical protein
MREESAILRAAVRLTRAWVTNEGMDMAKIRVVTDTVDVFLAGLDGMPENFLICRELQHIWKVTQPFRVVDCLKEIGRYPRGGQLVYAERRLTCSRCTMVRSDAFKISSDRGRTTLRKISANYIQPEGYAIPGTGYGARGLTDYVHGVAFDQAMEAEISDRGDRRSRI